MNQIRPNPEFSNVQEFEAHARREINKIIFVENIANILRAILVPLLLILSLAAFVPILSFFDIDNRIYPIFATTIMVVGYISAAYLLIKNLQKIRPFKYEIAESRFEDHYNIRHLSPFSIIGKRIINGDKNLWQIAHERLLSNLAQIQFKKRAYFPRIKADDKLLLALMAICAVFIGLDYQASFKVLKPDFAVYFGGAPSAINAWVVVKDNEGAITPLGAKDNQIKAGSEVEIEVNGTQFAPKAVMGFNTQKLEKTAAGKYQTRVLIKNSGTLKLEYFGTRARWQIKIIKPPEPHFKGKIEFNPVGDKAIAAHFTINNKDAVAKAQLVLRGKINGKTYISTHEIALKDITDGENNIIINTAESPLVGYDAEAWLEIANSDNQVARSAKHLINVPLPEFTDPLAQALAEIRLLLLRETTPYKDIAPDIAVIDGAQIDAIEIDASDNIARAPANIAKAYALLSGISKIEMPPLYKSGISYALSYLEGAKSTTEAHGVAAILWEIIEQSANDSQDSKAKMNDAIQKLKQAIENDADPQEIEQLQQELKQAIADHIASLSQQQGESGDMQVEDNTNLSNTDLQKMMNDINQNAQNGNKDDALSQLDNLSQTLQNLSVSNQGGNGGENGDSLSDMLNQQRDLMDDTNNAAAQQNPAKNGELAQKQEALEQKLQALKNGKDDSNLDAAAQNMRAAAEALKNGDLQGAQQQQNQALQNLKQSAGRNQDENGDNRDPLGRANDDVDGKAEVKGKANGKGEETKIPRNQDKNRVRDIIKTLREKLSNPDNEPDERDYYENLLKKK